MNKIARVLLPLVVLAAITALTIGATCCIPSISFPGLQIN